MKYIKKYWTHLLGALIGAIGGFLYWKFIGCTTGTCPITSSPINSTLYGVLLGVLFGGLFQKKEKTEK